MLNFLFRSRPSKKTTISRKARLVIEALEMRDCPSVDFRPAPFITLNTQVLAGHQVQLSGSLNDDPHPAGATINFSGAASGRTTTDASGNFNFTTSDASLGSIFAAGVDQTGLSTSTASSTIAVDPPTLSFGITATTPTSVTLSGTLTGIDAAGQPVTFSGVGQGSATTDANGNFSLTTSVASLGAIDATTTDLWGQAPPNTIEVDMTSLPSSITLNAQVLTGHQVLLTGTLTDIDAAGATVTFSGAASGSTVTDADGNFSFTTSAATLGTVYAVGTDALQQSTNPTSATIAVAAPVLDLSILNVSPTTVTLVGKVSGLDPTYQSVTISGVAQDSATTDAAGNFTLTTAVSQTGSIHARTTDQWGQDSNTATVNLDNIPTATTPTITLQTQILAGHEVCLTGTVTDDNAAAVPVTFSGAVTGSTLTDDDGNFSFTTEAATLGTVYASGTDQAQQSTNTASAVIAVDVPVVTLTVASTSPNTVTLTGTVSGLDAAGETVTISGVATDAVVCDASGNFTLTTALVQTGTIQASTTDLWGQSSNTAETTVDTLPAATSPEITLDAQVLAGHEVQLTGNVIGANAAGATVTFSGAVSGSAIADSAGHFIFTTTTASLGTVYAVGTDTQQQLTNTASTTLAVTAPLLTFACTGTSQGTETLSGQLTGVDVAYQTITLSGAVSNSVVTDAQGNFTFTTDPGTMGEIDATTTDNWGQESNNAAVEMPQNPPAIRNFRAQFDFGVTWSFMGTVVGQNVAGLTVTFGGIQTIMNQTATVLPNGNFTLTYDLIQGEIGTATAQVTDQWGRTSNRALGLVRW